MFASFDPAIAPTSAVDLVCSISSDDDPGDLGTLDCADYECDASTLHLVDRSAQIDSTITPGADGWSGWKYGLWTLNYLQVMHDVNETAVASVADADLANVGESGNAIIGDNGIRHADRAGDVSRLEQHRRLSGADVHRDDGQPRRGLADEAVDERWRVAVGLCRSAKPLSRTAMARPLRWFPGKVAVTETPGGDFLRCRATRSRRPTATRST